MFYYSEIGSHVKLPRSIKIEKVNEILQNLEVISTIFEEGSIIGFIECIEDNICTYMKENPIDSILKKILNLTDSGSLLLNSQIKFEFFSNYMLFQHVQEERFKTCRGLNNYVIV